MTNKEKLLINSWTERLLTQFEEVRKSYDYIRTKYEDLTSCPIKSIPDLIQAIVKCNRVGDNQRRADLNAVIKYLIASGQSSAFFSFLDLKIG